MKVVLADEARRNLADIADHIAVDSEVRAATFLSELRQCCEELAETPHAFPVVSRYAHLGVRRRVHQAYLILYRVSSDRIEVLHIVHGRRDLDALLFPPKS